MLFFKINKPSYLYAIACLMAIFSFSCDKSETEVLDLDFGYRYFPLEIGQYWEYAVDSVIYDPALGGTAIDTISSFIREEIKDTLRDNLGELLYRVEKFHRTQDTLPWQIQKALTLSMNEQQAIRTEDNLRFVNLIFPTTLSKNWKGTLFIDEEMEIPIAGENVTVFKGWESKVVSKGGAYEIGALNFSDVLEISIADDENLIEYRYGTEIYAAETGLVYRELKILDTQCQSCCNGDFDECEALSWEEKAEKGFIVRQRLIDFN